MSKAVKAVAGAALIYFSAGLASYALTGGAIGAMTATQAMLLPYISGAITLVGASLAGSALAPEMPDMQGADSYAGQALQTKKDNVSAVSQIFGEVRTGSSIIWQSSGSQVSGTPNKDYWSIQVVSEAEINDYLEMYANEDLMVDKGSEKHTLTYAHIKGYTTSGASGMFLSDIEFVKDQAGNSDTASNIGIDVSTTDQTKEIFTFSGNVDNDLYMTIRGATASGGTYSGSGIESTLVSGVASAGGYYDEYGEGWHGDLSASINYTPYDVDNFTSGKFYYAELTETSGGTITIIQQPTPANNYETKVKIYEGGGGEQTCAFKLQMKEGTGVYIPANLSFLAVHQVYNATDNAHTGLDNITTKLQGKKIRIIGASDFGAEAYSTNPADQVADILTNGLKIDSDNIDFASFYNAQTKCSSYGYACNILFNSQRNIQSVIKDILSTCRGQIVFSQGKWKMKIDEKSATVVKTITSDDILNGSLSISMKGFSEVANKIALKYINPLDNWLSAKVEIQDTDLVNMDGQEITKTLDIKGVTNSLQANKLAEITLNSMRYTEDAEGNRIKQAPLAISFATTVKNAELEVGDVFELQHDLLDRDRKFITLSVETDQSGAMKITAREYCETHYKNSAGVYLI